MTSLDIQYHPITLYVNQLQRNARQNGYLKIAFPTKTNTPNIVIGESEYVSTNLYIFDKVHYDLQIDHDAIMIIEHSSITNDFQTLYLCIPLLESSNAQPSDLDILIESKDEGPISIDISKYLKKGGNCVVYENEGLAYNDYVIVAMQPITVKANLMDFSTKPTMIEDINMNDPIQTISISSINTSLSPSLSPYVPIVEGMQDDVPMICTQIIEEGDEVMYEPVLQLSANSGAGTDIWKSQGFIYVKILIQILIVIAIPFLIVPTFIVPRIDAISMNPDNGISLGIHGFLFLMFATISILMITFGIFLNNNFDEEILGIYLIIVVCLSKYITENKASLMSGMGNIPMLFAKFAKNIGKTMFIIVVSFALSGILFYTNIISKYDFVILSLSALSVLTFFALMAGSYDLT